MDAEAVVHHGEIAYPLGVQTNDRPHTEAKFSFIDRGPGSGQVVVKPEGQKGVLTFDVRYALEGAGGVLGPWTTVTIAGPRKTIITGLTMAGIYHFQIRAFGKFGGYTDGMDNETFI